MAHSIAGLESWWLTTGFSHLAELVDISDIQISRRECGFMQILQRKLRAFDSNRSIPIPRCVGGVTAASPLRMFNPRRQLNEAVQHVFRRSADGGLRQDKAFEGLTTLEEVEVHRQRLLEATRLALRSCPMEDGSSDLIEALHHNATERYKLFQLGFRAMCLIDFLPQGAAYPDDAARVMARLNALFPPDFATHSEDELDLAPCSPGLRDSIRFCMYEHLMNDHAPSQEGGQSFVDKFTSWCSIPTYEHARNALLRYIEEVKKAEVACLHALHTVEIKCSAALDLTSPSGYSFAVSIDGYKSPEILPNTSNCSNACASDTSTIADTSIGSMRSSIHTSTTSISPEDFTPLLKGMPGREISAAKTDGAAFALDSSAPDVLSYPNDLSKSEFHVHPLAKYLDSDIQEKAQLGLIIPKELATVKPTRKKGKLLKRRGTLSDELPQAPPLPPIPESYRSATTPNLFGKLRDRIKTAEPETSAAGKDISRKLLISKKSEGSFVLRLSKGKRKASLKSQISDPTPNHPSSVSRPTTIDRERDEKARRSSDGSIHSPTSIDWAIEYQTQSSSGAQHDFDLAPPRLSPMEYARIYLIHRAHANREHQQCQLPAPEKQWFWTPGWEKFLIVPRIPCIIKRYNEREASTQIDPHEAFSPVVDPASPGLLPESITACPRLSLHLGKMGTFMPSVINLASLAEPEPSHYEQDGHPRRKFRRHSIHSEGERASLTTLAEDYPWVPSRQQGFLAARILDPDMMAQNGGNISSQLPLTKQARLPKIPPTARRQLDRRHAPSAASSRPDLEVTRVDFSLAARSCSSSPLSPSYHMSSTRKAKPLQVEGLTPGRIQSMTASVLGDTSFDEDFTESIATRSSNIQITPKHRLAPGLSDQRCGQMSRTTTQHQFSPNLDTRRHSMNTQTSASVHFQHSSLASVDNHDLQSPISTEYYSDSDYFANDPFIDNYCQRNVTATSSSQHLLDPTANTPLLDSPTLGYANVSFVQASDGNQNESQSFQLPNPSLESQEQCCLDLGAKTIDGFIDSTNQYPVGNEPALPLPKIPSFRKDTARRGYASSFALHRAKSHEAFTLLPRISPTNSPKRTNSNEKGVKTHLNPHGLGNVANSRTISGKSTALALQDFDTASRLADPGRPREPATALSMTERGKGAQRKTTFGTLLARHIRRSSRGN
ncbi:hypothetical protein QQS21_003302 [Conoideocrella luteorostrata]|uniref:Uncharacterized protein n=1 Tax=Conoideocrella luteorostrata TaxID=1105319 RepID=A0AAJ0CTF2_9HYPO|nr:hypothetical protein QQS21_003302 [Conoideocrella luteorostrata]